MSPGKPPAAETGEVSCRLFSGFLDELQRRRLPLEYLSDGTGYPPEHLLDRGERISWSSYCTLMANASRLWSDEQIAEIASSFVTNRAFQPFTVVARLFLSTSDLYRWINDPKKGPIRQLTTCLHWKMREFAADRHEVEFTMDEGYEPCREYVIACRGAIATTPRLLGLPDADVEMEETERGCRYSVRTSRDRGLLPRLKRWFWWFSRSRVAAEELREAFETLQESRDQLRDEAQERTRVARALRESEGHLRSVADHVPVVLFALDLDGVFQLSEGLGLKPMGLQPGEVVGQSLFDLYADHAGVCHDCLRAISGEKFMSTREVAGRTYETLFSPRRAENGELSGTIGVSTDVTERVEAERALREREALLRAALDNFPYEFWAVDREGRYTMQNTASHAAWGDLTGKTVDDLDATEELKLRWKENDRRALAGEVVSYQFERSMGEELRTIVSILAPIRSDGEIHGLVGVNVDVTDRRRLEIELRQKHKMESLGTLAGGIAHDFNNVLSAILGNAQLAQSKIAAGHPSRHNVSEIVTAGKRARDLVDQILAFSRREPSVRRALSIQPTVEEALSFLRSTIPKSISIQERLNAADTLVMANSTQIYQVIINLASNAIHAMRDGGGTLEVALEAIDVDEELAKEHVDLRPRPYLRLTVRDTGRGMDPAIVSRIFDPFFTTKEIGEGSGLGLSVVHGIVQDHRGTIQVDSRAGEGSSIQVYLPQAEVPGHLDAGGGSAGPAPRAARAARVLFIDDEAAVVGSVREMLEALGYDVATATCPEEALDAFRGSEGTFDLVITDQDMPRLSGEALAVEFRKIRPDIPMILCTGYSEGVTPEKAKGLGFNCYLTKPLLFEELGRAVSDALGEAAAKGG